MTPEDIQAAARLLQQLAEIETALKHGDQSGTLHVGDATMRTPYHTHYLASLRLSTEQMYRVLHMLRRTIIEQLRDLGVQGP